MKWKHLVLPSAVVCVAALSLGISITVRRLHAGGGAQVSPKAVPWVPYQIGYKTYNKKSDWLQPLLLAESMRAVRSDGASVESYIDYKLTRSILHQRGALNLPGGVHILTSERLGLMTATRDVTEDGDERARQRLDPSQSCAISLEGGQGTQSSVVAREMLLGYECPYKKSRSPCKFTVARPE
jgi:hypothetical protein